MRTIPARRLVCATRQTRARRPCATPSDRWRSAEQGQTLVEFALVLVVFLVVTIGLLDGLRVIFYYSQIQEAAREGARWGAVQVNRVTPDGTHTVGGTFGDWGNKAGVYCDPPLSPCDHSLQGARATGSGLSATTIVGAVTQASTAVTLAQATITVSTTIPATTTETLLQDDNHIADQPVVVAVTYPFKPILGMVFGGVTITLKGTSTMLHE